MLAVAATAAVQLRPSAGRQSIVSPRMSGQPKQQSSTQRERQAYRVPQSSTEQRKAHLVSDLEHDTSDSDSEAVPDQQHAEFYDSGADEKDEAYIQKERQGRQSDAILSCPGCLTTVCIDCQRHEYITTQYRAMFVRNCRYGLTLHFGADKQ